jgi:hypothetical protein
MTPVAVFTAPRFLRNLRQGPINWSICPFPAKAVDHCSEKAHSNDGFLFFKPAERASLFVVGLST